VRSQRLVYTPPADWVISTELQVNGRHICPGTELKISGEPGRFRFVRHVVNGAGNAWVDVVGGIKGHEITRSFRPERIRTVHRLTRLRTTKQGAVIA
jgi:hypothetical protein